MLQHENVENVPFLCMFCLPVCPYVPIYPFSDCRYAMYPSMLVHFLCILPLHTVRILCTLPRLSQCSVLSADFVILLPWFSVCCMPYHYCWYAIVISIDVSYWILVWLPFHLLFFSFAPSWGPHSQGVPKFKEGRHGNGKTYQDCCLQSQKLANVAVW